MTTIKKSKGEPIYVPPVEVTKWRPGFTYTRKERVCTSRPNPNYQPKMSAAEIKQKDEELVKVVEKLGVGEGVGYSTGGGSRYLYNCRDVTKTEYVPGYNYQETLVPGYYKYNLSPGWNAGARSKVAINPGAMPDNGVTPECSFFFTLAAGLGGAIIWLTEDPDERMPPSNPVFALRASGSKVELFVEGGWQTRDYELPASGVVLGFFLYEGGIHAVAGYEPRGDSGIFPTFTEYFGYFPMDLEGRQFYLRASLYLAGDAVYDANYHSGGWQTGGRLATPDGFASDTPFGVAKAMLAPVTGQGGLFSRGVGPLPTVQGLAFSGGGMGAGSLPCVHGFSLSQASQGGSVSWHWSDLPTMQGEGRIFSGHTISQDGGALATLIGFGLGTGLGASSGQFYGLLAPPLGEAFGTEGDRIFAMGDYAFGVGRIQATAYVVVVLNSRGQLTTMFDAQTILGADLLSKAQVGDSITGDMSLLAYIDSVVRGADGLQGQSFAGGGQVPNPGQQMPGGTEDYDGGYFVWVFNARTGAVSRYLRYGFDSFAQIGGHYFGVAEDGVYLLEGNTDAGQRIDARAGTGLLDLGAKELKHVSAVYLDAASDGVLSVRVQAGQQQYTYQARRASQYNAQQRVDTGRGLRATHYSFELLNGGADFELDAMDVNVAKSARRI